MSRRDDVHEYFRAKADTYDLVDTQVYWNLSSDLLWHFFDSLVLSKHKHAPFTFLDAGCGTGSWSAKVLSAYPRASGVLYDRSPEMLQQAEAKLAGPFRPRVKLIEGDIEQMSDLPADTFNVTFNFHNVLGFVESPSRALAEMTRVTAAEGNVVSVVPNKYHCVYFNLRFGRLQEAMSAEKSSIGKFTTDMPPIHLFTPTTMTELYSACRIEVTSILGFPVVVYPGQEETTAVGTNRQLGEILHDDQAYQAIYEIEKRLAGMGETAPRGNNLIIIGTKAKDLTQ